MSTSMIVGSFSYGHHLKKRMLAVVLVLGLPLLTPLGITLASAAEPEVTPDQVVTSIENVFGVTPGQRRNHIKGICAAGQFVGIHKAAVAYTRSALFSGKPVPVVARFSLAGGNPKAPDTAKSPRGMALEFSLPNNEIQHMTMLNVPVFGAARPSTFYDQMVALKPDPAVPFARLCGLIRQANERKVKRAVRRMICRNHRIGPVMGDSVS